MQRRLINRSRFCATLCLFCHAIAASAQGALPLRTLIVSGGPSREHNQYAIESNARYVEKLTATGLGQRVLFADGKRASRSISTYERIADEKEASVLAWILDKDWPASKLVFRAPTLKRLDGAATSDNILAETKTLASSAQNGERGLIYFTGHGSLGNGLFFVPDAENTVYNSWPNGSLSVRQLAPALQSWPENAPLTLVMVQCHSGGFANLIFQEGNPQKGLWPRDFCGFFASVGEREAAGCTSEVDEENYQDFTTHFFAALSGTSREGRPVTTADYDKNGTVSGLEALAYTHLHDDSIDVPVCTSEIYLRALWPKENNDWMKTPFSSLLKNAGKWQEVVLNGLSRDLKLTGETRIAAAFKSYQTLAPRLRRAAETGDSFEGDAIINRPDVAEQFYDLEAELLRRLPQLKSKNPRDYAAARQKAIAFLKTRRAAVDKLYGADRLYEYSTEKAEARAAKMLRLIRMARTVVLQQRLQTKGTTEQKAAFARLRLSESRNVLK